LISWDGPLLSQAIADRKEIVEHETGSLYIWVYDDRVFIDSKLYGDFVLSNFKVWKKIRIELEAHLISYGISEYYALVDSPSKFRWCSWLGMKTANELILLEGYPPIEIMKKEL
jgi:hypothetical protein